MDISSLMNPAPESEEEKRFSDAEERERRLTDALRDGYLIVTADPRPAKELVTAALRELHIPATVGSLQDRALTFVAERGSVCELLFNSGYNFSDNRYLTTLLGSPYDEAQVEIQGAVMMTHNPTQLHRTRVGPGRVLIWSPFDRSVNTQNGFFRVIKGSQNMSFAEVNAASTVEISLNPGQAIIIDGELCIQWPQVGSGLAQFKALKKQRD